MGFFKDIKSTLGSATEAAKNAPAAKQAADANAEALQAGLTPDTVDPNDPEAMKMMAKMQKESEKAAGGASKTTPMPGMKMPGGPGPSDPTAVKTEGS